MTGIAAFKRAALRIPHLAGALMFASAGLVHGAAADVILTLDPDFASQGSLNVSASSDGCPNEPKDIAVGETVFDSCSDAGEGSSATGNYSFNCSVSNAGLSDPGELTLEGHVVTTATGGGDAEARVEFHAILTVTNEALPFTLTISDDGIDGVPTDFRETHISIEGIGTYCDGACDEGEQHNDLATSGILGVGDHHVTVTLFTIAFGTHVDFASRDVLLTIRFTDNTEFRWNTGNGDYAVAENWDPAQVPVHSSTRNDTAIFNITAGEDDNGNQFTNTAYAVAAAGATAGRFVINNVELNLDGDATVFETSVLEPSLVVTGNGRLVLDDLASLSCVNASIGHSGSGTASVEVTDNGSQMLCSGRLDVGESSPGQVIVTRAHLECAAAIIGDLARGVVSVSGIFADWETGSLLLGATTGAGELEVSNGGRVNVLNDFIVGELSDATLDIAQGSSVNTPTMTIGSQFNSHGEALVHGVSGTTGSTLVVSGDLRVGVDGEGTLEIKDGAAARAVSVFVGVAQGLVGPGIGHVTVEGFDSGSGASNLLATSDVTVGHATFDVLRGATVDAAQVVLGRGGETTANISGFAAPNGVEDTQSDAKVTINNSLTVGADHNARLNVARGGKVVCADMIVSPATSIPTPAVDISGPRTDTGVSTIVHNSLRITGRLEPGNDDTVIVRDGGLLSTGTLVVGAEQSVGGSSLSLRGGPAENPSRLEVSGQAPSTTVIGGQSPGSLSLTLGATSLHNGPITIGDAASGVVRVSNKDGSAAQSLLEAKGRITVGNNGAGVLSVLDGAVVTCADDMVIAAAANAVTSKVNVEGSLPIGQDRLASFLAVEGQFTVGKAADAEVTINDHGSVTCEKMVVGGTSGGSGRVIIGVDSALEISEELTVAAPGEGFVSLQSSSSKVMVGDTTVVNAGGRIEGIGTLDSPTTIVEPGGFVDPGLLGGNQGAPKPRTGKPHTHQDKSTAIGTLTIDGDYEEREGGTLVIEVAGLEPGQFDVLHVTGNATLAGNVDLRFINGFVPQPSESVDFVVVDGTITGKLTGSTFIEAPGDPESGQPAVEAEVKWEVTSVGTCRMTVTDVTPLDVSARPLPGDCGAGPCGAGAVPLIPLTLSGLAAVKVSRRRRVR